MSWISFPRKQQQKNSKFSPDLSFSRLTKVCFFFASSKFGYLFAPFVHLHLTVQSLLAFLQLGNTEERKVGVRISWVQFHTRQGKRRSNTTNIIIFRTEETEWPLGGSRWFSFLLLFFPASGRVEKEYHWNALHNDSTSPSAWGEGVHLVANVQVVKRQRTLSPHATPWAILPHGLLCQVKEPLT